LLFAEAQAGSLLIAHAVVGASVVAVSTHLVVWTWRLVRGQTGRQRGIRWFAAVGLGLYLLQFTLGNLMYPVYKVRVRGEYLDSSEAVAADRAARAEARNSVETKLGQPPIEVPTKSDSLAAVSHLFDVKEHWVGLGLAMIVALTVVAFTWDAKRDDPAGGKLLFACAICLASCTWIAGLVGLIVTSHRPI
jgi:hypothetical protein